MSKHIMAPMMTPSSTALAEPIVEELGHGIHDAATGPPTT
jgi:hypothetical protein